MQHKNVLIYGAGGLGREIAGMLEVSKMNIKCVGYLDDFMVVKAPADYDDIVLAIADPRIRHKIIANWSRKAVPFNSLISTDIKLHSSVKVDKGCILCPGVKLTVDIQIGQFVIINLNSTIGHDVTIGDFTSIMPSVNISGNVKIGKRVFIGSGATILQGLTIGDDVVIGAGAVVTEDIATGKRVKGVPAKPW